MKKIAIASGKGGVGKSMLASSLALLLAQSQSIVAVDGDVDAPNLHLWLGENESWDKVKKISTNELAVIDHGQCQMCQKCVNICAFGALEKVNDQIKVNKFLCEGCGACEAVCPHGAISLKRIKNAEVKIKHDVHGFPLVSAQILPGQTGSGKVVEAIKKQAEKYSADMMILDAPAGIGCPVIAALQNIDLVVLITEPTPSGLSDLKRVLQVVNHFKTPFGVVINKWDINKPTSQKITEEFKDKILGKISYDQKIFQAISSLQPIMTTDLKSKREIKHIFHNLKDYCYFYD
jgi:MinD superfamily P-loop ATPase